MSNPLIYFIQNLKTYFSCFIFLTIIITIYAQTVTYDKFTQSRNYLHSLLNENPNDPSLLTNLGHLHWQYGYVDSALIFLKSATKIEPDLPEALLDLGMINWYRGSLEKAISFMEKAYELDTTNTAIFSRYALALSRSSQSKEQRKASEIFIRAVSTGDTSWIGKLYNAIYNAEQEKPAAKNQLLAAAKLPGCKAISMMVLGRFLLKQNETENACDLIIQGLENIQTNEAFLFIPPFYDLIMSKENQQILRNLKPFARAKYLASFWRSLDPTPVTPTNERLIEHFRRIEYADEHLFIDNGSNLDDRARVYIQYGEPDERYISISTQYSKPNETWTYFSKFPNLCFDFIETGPGMYRIAGDLSEAVLMPANYDMYGLDAELQRTLQSIYNERAHLGGPYSKIAAEEIGPENMLIQLHQYTYSTRTAQTSAPPTLYNISFKAAPLNFPFRIYSFKGNNQKTLVEIVYGILKNDLSFKVSDRGIQESDLDLGVFFSDLNQQPLSRFEKKIKIPKTNKSTVKADIYLDRLKFNMPAKTYQFAISARTEDKKKYGLYVDTLHVSNYYQPQIMLSSIELSLEIKDMDQNQKLKKDANTSKILPYPFPQVLQSNPITVYFEVYNLTFDENGFTHYEITYSLQSQMDRKSIVQKLFSTEDKKTFISSTIRQTGDRMDDIVYLNIDLQNIPSGPTTLRITVKDLNTDSQAYSKVTFNLR